MILIFLYAVSYGLWRAHNEFQEFERLKLRLFLNLFIILGFFKLCNGEIR